jgi:hypothetical protein
MGSETLRALFSRKGLRTASLVAAEAAEARTANTAGRLVATGRHLAAVKDCTWRSPSEPGAAILALLKISGRERDKGVCTAERKGLE